MSDEETVAGMSALASEAIARTAERSYTLGVSEERARCLAIVAGVNARRTADAARDACSEIAERIAAQRP